MHALAAFVVMIALNLLASNTYALTPKAVTASGWQEPNRPRNNIDFIHRTRWSCQGTCWIEYDFGEVMYMQRVVLKWWKNTIRTQRFDMHTSVDGSNWKRTFSGRSTIQTGPFEEPPEDGTYAGEPFDVNDDIRYLRITGYGNSVNDWNSLVQATFLPPADGVDELWIHAYILNVSASNSLSGNTADRAWDNDFSTFWTGGYEDYLEIELVEPVPVIAMQIAWMNGHLRIQQYAIDVSLDGESWTRVIEDESTGKSLDYESNVFSGYEIAKYVRVVGYGNNSKLVASQPKISITEVRVWQYFDIYEAELYGGGPLPPDLMGDSRQ